MWAIRRIRNLWCDRAGETMVSFGLILPLLVMLSLAILDFGITMFEYGRAAEATRRGARSAAVVDAIANLDGLESAAVVCVGNGGGVSCSGGAVTNADGFTAVMAGIQAIFPSVQPENVEITYSHSGLGLANAGGIKPFVTVRLIGYRHPMLMGAIPGLPSEITLPDFPTTEVLKSYIPG